MEKKSTFAFGNFLNSQQLNKKESKAIKKKQQKTDIRMAKRKTRVQKAM